MNKLSFSILFLASEKENDFMGKKYLLMTVAIVFALVGNALSYAAEKEHGHNTPHGGVVQEAEGIHAEFLIDKSGQPKIYLYDKSMKPLDRADLEAKLTVKGHGGTQETRVLKFSKDAKEGPLFKGDPIKGMTDWDTAVVSLKLKDTWTHVRFSHHSDGKGGH